MSLVKLRRSNRFFPLRTLEKATTATKVTESPDKISLPSSQIPITQRKPVVRRRERVGAGTSGTSAQKKPVAWRREKVGAGSSGSSAQELLILFDYLKAHGTLGSVGVSPQLSPIR